MTSISFHKILNVALSLGGMTIVAVARADPSQSGYVVSPGMMGGNGYGWMDGYGGMWSPILLVVVIIALVAWIVMQKRK